MPAELSERSPLPACQEQSDGLVDTSLPGLRGLGGVDGVHVVPLQTVGQPVEELSSRNALPIATAKSAGTSTSRGESATFSVTEMGSPPFNPVAARTEALTPIRCAPPMTATVLRYS